MWSTWRARDLRKYTGSIGIIIRLETLWWYVWRVSARPGRWSVGLGMAQSYPADVVILRCDAQLYGITSRYSEVDEIIEYNTQEKE